MLRGACLPLAAFICVAARLPYHGAHIDRLQWHGGACAHGQLPNQAFAHAADAHFSAASTGLLVALQAGCIGGTWRGGEISMRSFQVDGASEAVAERSGGW